MKNAVLLNIFISGLKSRVPTDICLWMIRELVQWIKAIEDLYRMI